MNSISAILDDILSLNKTINKKELEIEKRKELIEKMASSEVVIQKNEKKEEKVESKISLQQSALENKRQYYQNEIKLAQEKCDKEMRDAQEKYEKYRTYCHQQMELAEQKTDSLIKALEQQKESSSVSVTDDKILKRLEIEIQQLRAQEKEKQERYARENDKYHKARQQEILEQYQRDEEKQRQEDYRKREMILQQQQIERAERERKAEERRKQTQMEIRSIMEKENCDYETACHLWGRPKQSLSVKEKEDVEKLAKQIRIQYPQYKPYISEFDKEYIKKMVRLEGDALIQFLEKMKPLMEEKIKFEADETVLDDKHSEMYDSLTLDQKIECIKLKTKEKRYKYCEKNQRTRAEQINDSLGCV